MVAAAAAVDSKATLFWVLCLLLVLNFNVQKKINEQENVIVYLDISANYNPGEFWNFLFEILATYYCKILYGKWSCLCLLNMLCWMLGDF